ncbi:MAG: ATP-binding protein [Methylacidiphilales bacterium]|nr:ATP-binding protein [Candidatus Methylacidiphilales bacterium]
MPSPLGADSSVVWSDYIRHAKAFTPFQTLEQVHQKMLAEGIDFAAQVDENNVPIGLVSSKLVAGALSVQYGQALFAKKKLGALRVPGYVLGAREKEKSQDFQPLVIGLDEAIVLNSTIDFFTAQSAIEKRPREHRFDDLIVISDDGTYLGMIEIIDFFGLQTRVSQWQDIELRTRNQILNETLTALQQTQAVLASSAKMASLGELVAGIAHEMNTPLGILVSSHDVIENIFDSLTSNISHEQRLKYHRLIRTNIDLGRQASDRVSHIISSLRTFGRDDHQQKYDANLPSLIHGALVLLANKFKEAIKIHIDLPIEGNLACYPGQLSQVLVNVLTNAYQAMDGRGHLWISAAESLNEWEIMIRDTGPGIPVHLLERIFDPGFTTKGVGVGTGLGLSISKKIIELNHGGLISASNHPEGGAVFLIKLPKMLRERDRVDKQSRVQLIG